MTKQQFDDLYLDKAVHCDTEEKANEFLKLAHRFGWEWLSRRSLLEINNYYRFQEKTCYLVGRDGFKYCDKDFYIENGYEVVEFKQETLNVGDVVYDESGQRLEVIGFGVKVRTKNRVEFYRPSEQLSKTKPLKKITRKELADKGYELVD